MIKYSLKCKDCSFQFESWFGSSKEFDRLKKLKLLNCQNCNSLYVVKNLMSPNLINTNRRNRKITQNLKNSTWNSKNRSLLSRSVPEVSETFFRNYKCVSCQLIPGKNPAVV